MRTVSASQYGSLVESEGRDIYSNSPLVRVLRFCEHEDDTRLTDFLIVLTIANRYIDQSIRDIMKFAERAVFDCAGEVGLMRHATSAREPGPMYTLSPLGSGEYYS